CHYHYCTKVLLQKLEKAYDKVPRGKLWEYLREYNLSEELLRAIQALYKRSRSCVRISDCKSESFDVTTGLRQGCVLSPLLFIIFMDRISRRCTGPGVKLWNVEISKLFFADDLVLLASTAEDLQRLLNRVAPACDKEDMTISTPK